MELLDAASSAVGLSVAASVTTRGGGWLRTQGMRPPTERGDPVLRQIVGDASRRRWRRLAVVVADPSGEMRSSYLGCGPDTPFEIGSLTKPFVGMLLADAFERGELTVEAALRDVIAGAPRRIGGLRLVDLATHRSGLPRIPRTVSFYLRASLFSLFLINPYAHLDGRSVVRDAARAGRRAPRQAGRFLYSNLGAALLGVGMARFYGLPLEALLRDRILGPLGMATTTLRRPRGMARGLNGGRPASLWRLDGYAAAGGLCATPGDMGRFAHALLTGAAPGGKALDEVAPGQGLFWMRSRDELGSFAWHNGQTGGYSAFAQLDLGAHPSAVVVMADVAGADDLQQIARAVRRVGASAS